MDKTPGIEIAIPYDIDEAYINGLDNGHQPWPRDVYTFSNQCGCHEACLFSEMPITKPGTLTVFEPEFLDAENPGPGPHKDDYGRYEYAQKQNAIAQRVSIGWIIEVRSYAWRRLKRGTIQELFFLGRRE